MQRKQPHLKNEEQRQPLRQSLKLHLIVAQNLLNVYFCSFKKQFQYNSNNKLFPNRWPTLIMWVRLIKIIVNSINKLILLITYCIF